jgi:hypothetical protein
MLCVESEVLTTVVLKSSIFGDIMAFSLLKLNRRFGEHIESALLATCFHACFLLVLFFNSENGGDMFLLIFGWFRTDYTA